MLAMSRDCLLSSRGVLAVLAAPLAFLAVVRLIVRLARAVLELFDMTWTLR